MSKAKNEIYKPNCDMPECVGKPGDRVHMVRGPSNNAMRMCDGCIDNGWGMHVEIIDNE